MSNFAGDNPSHVWCRHCDNTLIHNMIFNAGSVEVSGSSPLYSTPSH